MKSDAASTREPADHRDLGQARTAAMDALVRYAKLLDWWNEPDFEHSALQLRTLVREAIEEARR